MNVLIDLDGTLTNPAQGIVACLRHALTGLGRECPCDSELERFIGPPLHENFRVLLDTNDAVMVAAAIALYRERFSVTGLYENEVYPEIPAALAAFAGRGATLYVATSKPWVYAEQILRHFRLDGHFKVIYGSELDGTRTNKAELIAHIMEREALAPEVTYMVGDRKHDVIGAAANGVRSVGVLWGYGSRDELTGAGATVLCEKPGDLWQTLMAVRERAAH